MAKTKTKKQKTGINDSVFVFKLGLYLVLGSLWFKFMNDTAVGIPIPAGLIGGLILASHEHFQIDRKIEYAVLLIGAFLGFWLPFGVYISM